MLDFVQLLETMNCVFWLNRSPLVHEGPADEREASLDRSWSLEFYISAISWECEGVGGIYLEAGVGVEFSVINL